MQKLVNALTALGARPLLAEDFDPGELVVDLDVEDLRERAPMARVPGLRQEIAVAGVDDLIAMKTAAGRAQDLLDIADLERARGKLD